MLLLMLIEEYWDERWDDYMLYLCFHLCFHIFEGTRSFIHLCILQLSCLDRMKEGVTYSSNLSRNTYTIRSSYITIDIYLLGTLDAING
ncbi:hypothetical protein EYC80_000981 [Monilinia laxa]|uniref:Uncharacterized protein n=1 Tax=Monilinia laxa TaxID=61186 RepID=A0A5N6K8M1_MONLA|nr:hypothetical protein EYC80_000981 [Monilinia laxa]